MPSPAEREELLARAVSLSSALVPGDREEIKTRVAGLLKAFAGREVAEIEQKLSLSLYGSALASFPLWVVSEVCRRTLEGRAETITVSAFAPSPPQLAAECRRIVEPYLAECGAIHEVLQATPYDVATDEQRARIDRLVADLKESLAAQSDRSSDRRERTLADIASASDRLRERDRAALGVVGAPGASPALVAKLREMAAVLPRTGEGDGE